MITTFPVLLNNQRRLNAKITKYIYVGANSSYPNLSFFFAIPRYVTHSFCADFSDAKSCWCYNLPRQMAQCPKSI